MEALIAIYQIFDTALMKVYHIIKLWETGQAYNRENKIKSTIKKYNC
jgi:hypothetical protein